MSGLKDCQYFFEGLLKKSWSVRILYGITGLVIYMVNIVFRECLNIFKNVKLVFFIATLQK